LGNYWIGLFINIRAKHLNHNQQVIMLQMLQIISSIFFTISVLKR